MLRREVRAKVGYAQNLAAEMLLFQPGIPHVSLVVKQYKYHLQQYRAAGIRQYRNSCCMKWTLSPEVQMKICLPGDNGTGCE